MNGSSFRKVFFVALICIMVVGFVVSGATTTIKNSIEYKCDVKNFTFSTTIEIDKAGQDFAKVKGNILRVVTDPLTMYDTKGSKIAYADDSYHFVAQDSHFIYANDTNPVEMVGKVKIFGEEYDIYDNEGKRVAEVNFNAFNTEGTMCDVDGNTIATFRSRLFFKDFTVNILEDCKLDEKTVLMIFCSYYSDQAADTSK